MPAQVIHAIDDSIGTNQLYGWVRVPAKQGISSSVLLDYHAGCLGSTPRTDGL
jgi:hypothetical protein